MTTPTISRLDNTELRYVRVYIDRWYNTLSSEMRAQVYAHIQNLIRAMPSATQSQVYRVANIVSTGAVQPALGFWGAAVGGLVSGVIGVGGSLYGQKIGAGAAADIASGQQQTDMLTQMLAQEAQKAVAQAQIDAQKEAAILASGAQLDAQAKALEAQKLAITSGQSVAEQELTAKYAAALEAERIRASVSAGSFFKDNAVMLILGSLGILAVVSVGVVVRKRR